jgi:hypothetical protein
VSRGSYTSYALPPQTWPSHIVHLCYWGCETDSYVDAANGRVYCLGGGGASTVVLSHQDDSLEGWYETWVQGRWREWFRLSDEGTNAC